jgi:hypothetical protein
MIGKKEFMDKMVEEVYFDLLNEYVGRIWLTNIVIYCLFNEGSFETEDIMPLSWHLMTFRKRLSLKYVKSKHN